MPDVAPAIAPAAPAASGPTYTLRLTTIPDDAEIAIDGRVVGAGSIEAPLAAGVDHSLTIRAEGHVAHQSTVNLSEDTRRQVELPWTEEGLAARGEVFSVSLATFTTLGGSRGGVLWLAAPVVRGGGLAWTTFEAFAGLGMGPGQSSIGSTRPWVMHTIRTTSTVPVGACARMPQSQCANRGSKVTY